MPTEKPRFGKVTLQPSTGNNNDRRPKGALTMWIYADAVNLAIDLYRRGEIAYKDLDKEANEIWQDMQAQNDAIMN